MVSEISAQTNAHMQRQRHLNCSPTHYYTWPAEGHSDLHSKQSRLAGHRVWIYQPMDLGQLDLSYSHFRQSLESFLFGQLDQSTGLNPPPLNCTW